MLDVTPSALINLTDYLRQQKIDSAIRITMMSGGCAGPALGLAVDDTKENDKTFEYEDVSLVVDKELLATCGAITVDFIDKSDGGCGCAGSGGFAVTCEKPLADGGCSCSCSSGSCG